MLIAVAALAALTAAGVGLWLLISPAAPLLKYEKVFTFRTIAVVQLVYAKLILASALLMRRMRGYVFVLLCVPFVGILAPAAIAFYVRMTWGGLPEWPAFVPLWLGVPAAVWVTVLLFRLEVRGAFQ